MEKLKGLYVKHQVENGNCLVWVQQESGIINKWNLEELQRKQTEEAMKWLRISEAGGQLKGAVMASDVYNRMAERANLYEEILNKADAGLPIDKYWEGKHIPPKDGEEKSEEAKEKATDKTNQALTTVPSLQLTSDKTKETYQQSLKKAVDEGYDLWSKNKFKDEFSIAGNMVRKYFREVNEYEGEAKLPNSPKTEQFKKLRDNIRNLIRQRKPKSKRRNKQP
ncbi:MAG: hypothetical protein M1339_02290 [Bacteroidetes bacterium]|nr:hypothetical protein [Bacteroidota bacterium]